MKVGGEFLRIDASPTDEAGTKLEPEEKTAIEAITLPIDVTIADHAVKPGSQAPSGAIHGLVGSESTAGEVAQNTATRCELCEHWRQADWIRHLRAIEDTPEGSAQIDMLRGELLGRASDGVVSIDEDDLIRVNVAIRREFGICAAFTESTGIVTASPYYGGCPMDDTRFKVRDMESKRIASDGYDKILRMAQGRNK